MKQYISTIILVLTIFISCNNSNNPAPDISSKDSFNVSCSADPFAEGKTLMNEHKYNEAVDIFSNQIKITPQTSELYVQRAIAYDQLNKFDLAIKDMDIAIQLNRQNLSAMNLRGQIKYNAGFYKDAINDFDSVIFQQSDFSSAYLNKGVTLLKLNKRDEACENFLFALKYGESNAQTLIDSNCNN